MKLSRFNYCEKTLNELLERVQIKKGKKKRKKWIIQTWNIDTLEQGEMLDKKGEIKQKQEIELWKR